MKSSAYLTTLSSNTQDGIKGAGERLKKDVEAIKKQAQEGIEDSTSNV